MAALLESLRAALGFLLANRQRSLLVALTVSLGAGVLAFMMTAAESGITTIVSGIDAVGGRGMVAIFPRSPEGASVRRNDEGVAWEDGLALGEHLRGAAEVFPLAVLRSREMVTDGKPSSVDVAVGEGHRPLVFPRLAAGHDAREAREVVLSAPVARRRFGTPEAALGKHVLLMGLPHEVVGVTADEGNLAFPVSMARPERAVFVSASLVRRDDALRQGTYLLVRHGPAVPHEAVVADVERFLAGRHRFVSSAQVFDIAQMLHSFEAILLALKLVIGAVALLALVVAGAGITNVMLASVQERIREFGLRRAIGASARVLRQQLLVETLLLAGTGGLFGATFGLATAALGGALLHSAVAQWRTVVSPGVFVLAMGAACGVSLVFGTYPARAAARLVIVECLREAP
jgi:putative ABC transport system permease protein